MRIIKNRKRWWVYLDPDSDLERQVIWEAFNKRAPGRIILDWTREHGTGRWSYTNAIATLKGDDREYTAFRFEHQEDAILFKLRFEAFKLD